MAAGIGVFGGSFNPPHLGHLILAAGAAADCGLEKVVLVPTGNAPHKTIEADPGGAARLAMTGLAVAGDPQLECSSFEVDRATGSGKPSFTLDTLEHLAGRYPGQRLKLLLGADAALGLADWYRPAAVLALADLVVAARHGSDPAALGPVLDSLGAAPPRVVQMPVIEISSTAVRRRIREGRPIRHLVPETVREYIAARGLYR